MCVILYIIITYVFSPLPYLYKVKIHIPFKKQDMPHALQGKSEYILSFIKG